MFDVSFELTAEYRMSAECKQVLKYALETDAVIDSKAMAENGNEFPFSEEDYKCFCNSMITLHRASKIFNSDGITVVGDGVRVSTVREQGHRMSYRLQREPLAPSV